jgi:hypothetical protein
LKHLLILLLLFVGFKAASQDLSYHSGYIVMQTKDTIFCWVPIESSFGDKIPIRHSAESDEENIPLIRIKYLVTQSNKYENISFKKKGKEIHKLMWLEVEGKLNLYLEIENNASGSSLESAASVTIYKAPTKTYVVRKGDSTFLIDKKNFIATIKPVIADNKDLTDKVESQDYDFDNIDVLIRDYNALVKPN